MLFRRGGEKPEVGQLKELKCSGAALAAIVERQGRKGWHIADGRNGTDDLRDKFRKSHVTVATEQGNSGGVKSVTPAGSVSVTVNNKTLTSSTMPAHAHDIQTKYTGLASGLRDSIYGITNNGSNTVAENKALSEGGGGSHNHSGSGSFSGSSQDNQPQYIIVLLLQYTGQKVSGVTP